MTKDAKQTESGNSPVYKEDLPDNCPPMDSIDITNDSTVYRLVKANPATNNDFRSQKDLKPNCIFRGITECQLRGLSVHTDKSDSEKLLKLPKFRKCLVCRVTLGHGAGKIKQTNKPSHHTWWPFAEYDILTNCEIEIQ